MGSKNRTNAAALLLLLLIAKASAQLETDSDSKSKGSNLFFATPSSKRQVDNLINNEGGQIPIDDILQTARLICELFSQSSTDLTQTILSDEVLPNVEPCPPTLKQVDVDVRFHQDPIENNANCRLQASPFQYVSAAYTYSFVQQCCYDTSSNGALYKELPEAGSLIGFDPVTQRDMYNNFDKPFRESCCDKNGGCSKFTDVRPINNGTGYKPPRTTSAMGTNFFVAAPSTLSTSILTLKHDIYVGTAYSSASYTIENSFGTQVASGTAMHSAPSVYKIDNFFKASTALVLTSGFTDRNKGLHIMATGSESLFVLYTLGDNSFYGSYLAYPCVDFQENIYEYYVISVQAPDFDSQVLLVGCEDNTNITITPTASVNLPLDAQMDSSLVTVASGSTSHTLTLHQTQTLLFKNVLDLTGTKIVSNKPLTVISGHECGTVPIAFNFCEQLAVQIPPTLTWGTEFLLAPFAIRSTGQIYRIVAAENVTALSIKECGADTVTQVAIPQAGGVFTLETTAGSYYYVTSSRPIFVTQLATGRISINGGDGIGDPVMLIVSPTHMYVNSTTFITLDSRFTQHAISVTILAKNDFDSSDILFDGEPLNCTWKAIENTTGNIVGWGCIFTNLTDSSQHYITYKNEGALTVLSYGFGAEVGYGYLAGMSLQRPIANDFTTVPDIFNMDAIPFFDLKGFARLSELPRVQDANSEPIFIPRGMIVDDRIVTSVYVSENGAFSFDAPWKFSHPNRYPTNYIFTQNSDVFSPFWADNDIRRKGTVRYVPIARGESTEGDELLDMMVEFLQMRDGIASNYIAKWMIVAQWDHVHPHPHGADDHMGIPEDFLELTNTFQGIIITDNIDSYYLFSYTCGDIEWSTLGRESAVVGYNAHSNDFFNHPSSGFSSVGNSISCMFTVGSKRQAGNMTNTMTGVVPANKDLQKAMTTCNFLVNNDPSLNTITTEIVPNVEACPSSLSQLQKDRRFRLDTITNTDPNRECYLQVAPFRFTTTARIYSFVQQCCYNPANGALYLYYPEAGTLISYDPINDNKNYNDNDKLFKQYCCESMVGCNLFLLHRPIDQGNNYEPPAICYGTGDPHYNTFDGLAYDFQGNGEYVHVEILDTNQNEDSVLFQVQGRTGFIPSWHTTRVTGHRSVAFGRPSVTVSAPQLGFQFVSQDNLVLYETPNNAPMDILGTVTNDFTPLNGNLDFMIKLSTSTTIIVVHSSGIVIEARWYGTYMNVWMEAPGRLNGTGRVRGLCGNFDGNSANDFANRADPGNPLPKNLNSQQIFNTSETWAVVQTESLFHDQPIGRKKRQAHNPVFLEDLNPTPEQIAFCNNDSQCLLDLIITNDTVVAMTTMEVNVEVGTTRDALNNFPPNITGDTVFNVTVGQESTYTFTVEDDGDDFNVTVVNGLPDGATLEPNGGGTYTIHWTLQNASDAVPISFLATDSGGAAAMLAPQVQVCGCVNGECTLGGILDLNTPLIILNCVCQDAYDGDFCERDIDGCTQIECFEGVACIDVPAPGVGAMCGNCPIGFNGDGEKCTDVNECTSIIGMQCEFSCVNTVGSFECECFSGFELAPNGFNCSDIDECAGPNGCQETCMNTNGSFLCSCRAGFVLGVNGMDCEPIKNCTGDEGCSDCCAVINGTATCCCPAGYELGADNLTCTDVDECMLFPGTCEQICNNTNGSFLCSCMDGFVLNDDMTGCNDINECEEAALLGMDLCASQPNTQCANIERSFLCECVPGYFTVKEQCLQRCSGDGGCSHICAIVNSTETCFCPNGFMLAPDGLTCYDKLPDLHLTFAQDSPIVRGRNVTAYIESSEPVSKMMCRITGHPDIDCISGMVHYSNLPVREGNKAYILRVEGTTDDGRLHIIRRKIRIEQPGFCTAHLINNGVTVHGSNVTIEFVPTGYTESTACILDPPKTKNNRFFDCSSPVVMAVRSGSHKFKVTPRGCGEFRFPIKVEFHIPEE